MTSIVIHEFGGMQPRIGDEFLATESASDAENCLLLSGELRPLHAPTLLNIFYPGRSHQENADKFGPEFSGDPWETYNNCAEAIFVSEGLAPYVWIKGPEGVVNDATATAAVAWVDHNPQLVTDFGEPEASAETQNRLIDFNPLPPSRVFSTEAETPGAWFLESGGAFATQTRDGLVVSTDYEQFNRGSYNTIWNENQTPYQDSFNVGWPVKWRLGATNLYATSTDPGVPPESLPDGNVFFRIRSPDVIGGEVFVANEAITDRGTSVSVPDQSGIFKSNGADALFQVETQLQYDFDSLGDGPPDTTSDIDHEAQIYTPYTGHFANEPWGLFIEDAAILLSFVFEDEFEEYRDEPEGPVFLDSHRQTLLFIGGTELYIEGNVLWFYNGGSGTSTRRYRIATLDRKQEYNFAATIREEGGSGFTWTSRFYLNGGLAVEATEDPRWNTGSGTTVMRIGRFGSLVNQQSATLCPIGQIIVYEQWLSEQQIFALHQASQDIECTPDQGSFDTYVEDNFPGLSLWVTGVDGLSNAADNDNALDSSFSFTGVQSHSFNGDSLLNEGLSIDPAGGRGNTMEHIWPFADDYLPANPGRGTLGILLEDSGGVLATYTGDDVSAFGEKIASNLVQSRGYLPYNLVASVDSTGPAANSPSASLGISNGTFQALSADTNGTNPNSRVLTPELDKPVGQTAGNWTVGFFQSPSDGVGGVTQSTYSATITGHCGTLYSWDDSPFTTDILLAFPNVSYKFHMMFDYEPDPLGNPNVQALFRGGRSTTFSGVEIYIDNGALYVQHGEGNRALLFNSLDSEYGNKQLIVSYDASAQEVVGYLNGVKSAVLSLVRCQPGVGGTFDQIGVARVAGLAGGFSTWPLIGRWQHLWYGAGTVTDQEAADLYTAALDAGFSP